jgi:glucosamine kinase
MAVMPESPEFAAEYLVGIDGGGSGTRAVLARGDSAIIGRGEAGASALGQGISQAWRNVELAIRGAFESAGLPVPGWHRCAVAAGLSGVGNPAWRRAFIAGDIGFAQLDIESDSFTMLLGAHNGRPGSILAAGTGSIAEALSADGTRRTAGGWGFPAGDEGSGAWLGLQAVRHAQRAMDGRDATGPLAERIWVACGEDRESLQGWCARAGQFAYAQLAPAVFELEDRDPAAALLLERATTCLENLAIAVDPAGKLPLAVSGSIGARLAPRMAPVLRDRMVPVKKGPAEGALMLARQMVRSDSEAMA